LWKCYELKFKAKSPIHIGYGSKLGIINRTRYYIPGKTIWGAVTAILAREGMEDYKPNIYKNVGNFVKKHMIFSYFYPLKDENVLYPNYTDNGFGFGKKNNESFLMSKEEFERDFITSYVSTAIDKSSKTAEEGSLHEFELIKDKSNGKETIFAGYLFAKEGAISNGNYSVKFSENGPFIETKDQNFPLFDAIRNVQVGGERNYGFGWFELCEKKEINKPNLYNSNMIVNLTDLSLEDDIHIALAHVNTKNLNLTDIRGDLEPLVGREWNSGGAGQKVSDAKICLTPGTKFNSESKIKIGCYGLWNNRIPK
jgi:hypothetical protein